MTRIRRIYGDMPFDQNGKHATGREVFTTTAAGTLEWMPEYEGDPTENLPVTDDQEEENEDV